jgi:hypothetical protein
LVQAALPAWRRSCTSSRAASSHGRWQWDELDDELLAEEQELAAAGDGSDDAAAAGQGASGLQAGNRADSSIALQPATNPNEVKHLEQLKARWAAAMAAESSCGDALGAEEEEEEEDQLEGVQFLVGALQRPSAGKIEVSGRQAQAWRRLAAATRPKALPPPPVLVPVAVPAHKGFLQMAAEAVVAFNKKGEAGFVVVGGGGYRPCCFTAHPVAGTASG